MEYQMLKRSIYAVMFANLCFGGFVGCMTPEVACAPMRHEHLDGHQVTMP